MNNRTIAVDKLKIGRAVLDFFARFGVIIVMVLLLVIFQIIEPRFLYFKNVMGVLNTSTILVTMSLAMTICMSVRGVDLSVAQMADMAGVIVAMLILADMPFWLAIIIALIVGLIVGILNGILISYLGVPAIIGTLGMMFVIRSVELTMTNGAQAQTLFMLPPAKVNSFFFIGQGSIGHVSILVIICVFVVSIIYFFKERSIIGRHMDAIQGNVRTAYLSSINVRQIFAFTFVISSLLSTTAGIMLISRTGNAVPRAMETYLTDCFVAVYLGTLLSRHGRFNVIGTVVGSLFVGFLSNFCTIIGFGAAYKSLFNGIFIILAVSLSAIQRHKRSNLGRRV